MSDRTYRAPLVGTSEQFQQTMLLPLRDLGFDLLYPYPY